MIFQIKKVSAAISIFLFFCRKMSLVTILTFTGPSASINMQVSVRTGAGSYPKVVHIIATVIKFPIACFVVTRIYKNNVFFLQKKDMYALNLSILGG